MALASGCRIDEEYPLSEDFGLCLGGEQEGQAPEALLTYYEHAKPILDARCAGCHSEGNIGPFSLDNYQDAFVAHASMREAVVSGQMPPWQPDPCCTDYRFDESLRPDERETLLAWIAQGALEGDPADEAPAIEVDRPGLTRVDARTTMPEPFTPVPIIGADEVRCFLLDYEFAENTFVTGLNVVPGNRSMVHHVIVLTIDGKNADKLEAKGGEDGRPGWDCYGELAGDGVQPTGALGGMTPGSQGVVLPDGLGRKVKAGSRIVLNMHYDTGAGFGSDQTTLEMQFAETITAELKGTAVANPLWLAEGGMPIPAGEPNARFFFSYDPTTLTTKGKPFLIYSVNHHMHELGTLARIAILRADGTEECLLNITDWDFDWLAEYFFAEPIPFNPGDKLFVECHFDNTAANQRFIDGEQIEPRDIDWGTDEEMCAGLLGIVVQE